MQIKDRLEVGKILISEFERLSKELDPYSEDLQEIIKRAIIVTLKMKAFYLKWDEPPEMQEQIDRMNSIIKKLQQIQNKHVTDM